MKDFFGRTIKVGDEVVYSLSTRMLNLARVVEVHPDHLVLKRIATSESRWRNTWGRDLVGARLMSQNLPTIRWEDTASCLVVSGADDASAD